MLFKMICALAGWQPATSVANGFSFAVHATSHPITITPSGGQTIQGQPALNLSVGSFGTVYCDGSNWYAGFSQPTTRELIEVVSFVVIEKFSPAFRHQNRGLLVDEPQCALGMHVRVVDVLVVLLHDPG